MSTEGQKTTELTEVATPTPTLEKGPVASVPAKSNKLTMWVGAGLVVALVVAGGVAFATRGRDKGPSETAQSQSPSSNGSGVNTDTAPSTPTATGKIANAFSTNSLEVANYLSHNACEGEGSKKLNHPVMKPEDLSVILPYGLTAGGHVTPVDHQYYYGKNQAAAADTYNVYAPADGTLVDLQVRPRGNGKADYRVITSYSCTFFSYFDLATSLSPEITAQLPAGWQTANGPQTINIPVKEGQILGKVGGQSLDFAVWDMTKKLDGLLVPMAYANLEPWKIYTVEPLNYYTDALKAQVLPLYTRSVEPRDGLLDYDVDGKVIGNWFKKGTNGYIGAFNESSYDSNSYADGHLSIAPDLYDPSGWIFSTGAVNHGTQYGIKNPTPTPDKFDASSGMVKYSLVQLSRKDETGNIWVGKTVPKSIKLNTETAPMGTALVQMIGTREIKVEIFLNKTAAQVTDFTGNAATYTRGDDATMMMNR